MADLFPVSNFEGKFLRVQATDIRNIWTTVLVYELEWIATIEFDKSEAFFANRGGMPVSHHRDFAMMPVAQFLGADISLGMPSSLH